MYHDHSYAGSTSTSEGRCLWLRWRSKYLGDVRISDTLELGGWALEMVPERAYLPSSEINFRGLLLPLGAGPIGLSGW